MTAIFIHDTKDIPEAIEAVARVACDAISELQGKLDAKTGKVMAVKSASLMGKRRSSISNYGESYDSYECVAGKARGHAYALFNECKEVHNGNEPALENNKQLVKTIHDFMSNIGINKTYSASYYKTERSRTKTHETRRAGYVSDISRLITTDDGFQEADRDYKAMLQDIDKYVLEKETEKKNREKQEEAIAKAELSTRLLGAMQERYGLTGEWEDVLEHLLNLDKYLSLAHGMWRNRCDWNDGFHFAESALARFHAETDQDKEIADDVSSAIDEWDGDGRVFRDIEWNYDRIFGLVPEGLLGDYRTAIGNINYY